MRVQAGMVAMVAACILLHGSYALMDLQSEKTICQKAKEEKMPSGLTKFWPGLGIPAPATKQCFSDLCHEENTNATDLHEQLKNNNKYLLDGDILCPAYNRQAGTKVVKKGNNKWKPNITYTFDNGFDNGEKTIIINALNGFVRDVKKDTVTCELSLTNANGVISDQHILFKKGDGYFTAVGKGSVSPHTITLGPVTAERTGSVLHELLHALGFWHEHARPDRDEIIDIKWNNIIETETVNFFKLSDEDVYQTYKDIAYDPCSILHYGPYAFSKSPKAKTILYRKGKAKDCIMGQRLALMPSDIERVQKLFDCKLKSGKSG